MPFGPPAGIHVGGLTKTTPTPFTKDVLQQQMENVGLSCAMLQGQNLDQYITEVSSQLFNGNVETMGIVKPSTTPSPTMLEASDVTTLEAAVGTTETAAQGNWTINNKAEGYAPHLEVIQYPTHFDWLYQNRATNGFTGVVRNPPTISGNYPNASSIQKLFITTGQSASATLVKGLDKDSMLAALTNVIQPLENANLSNYLVPEKPTDPWPSIVIYLVDNYNESTGVADGIGVLFFSWTLKITDYKRKTKDGGDTHPTSLMVKSGAVLYSDPSVLCNDFRSVVQHFGLQTQLQCPVPTA